MSQTEDLPGFTRPTEPTEDHLDPEVTTVREPSPTEERPKISDPDPPSREEGRPESSTTSSSTTSSEVDEALAGYGAAIFFIATTGINRAAENRSGHPTQRWLATEEETQRFGEALGRIASRRIPDEVTENQDAADVLIMGEVALTYGLRTMMNMTPEQATAAGEAYVEERRARPASPQPPPPPAPTVVPHAEADLSEQQQNNFGAVAATPPPPDVITPVI